MTVPNGRRSIWWMYVLMVIISVMHAGDVRAQGTMGMLPDPMTTSELMRDVNRLNCSPEQVQAIQHAHATYRANFRVLREGDIAEVMALMGGMNNQMPNREEITELLREMDRVQKKISTLDQQLFDSVAIVLADEQRGALERIRLRRERTRYRQSALNFLGGGGVNDVGEIIDEMSLTPESRVRVTPIIESYEIKLTRELRDTARDSSRMILTFFDAMDERGLTAESLQDPEQAAEAMQAILQVQQEIFGKAAEDAREMAERNRKTVSSLVSNLTPTEAMELRVRFLAVAEPSVSVAVRRAGGWWRVCTTTAASNDAERAALDAAAVTLRNELDPTIDTMLEESLMRVGANLAMADDRDIWSKYMTKVNEATMTLDAAVATAREQLAAGFTATRMQELAASAERDNESDAGSFFEQIAGSPQQTAAESAESASHDALDVAETAMVDGYVAPRISPGELNRYCDLLGVDDAQRDQAHALHESYASQYESLEQTMRDGYSMVQSYIHLEEAGTWKPNPDFDLDHYHASRASAIAQGRALDAEFFMLLRDELGRDADDEAFQRVIDHRTRRACRLTTSGSVTRNSNEHSVELAALVRTIEQRDELPLAAQQLIAEHERAITPLFITAQESSLAVAKATDEWTIRQADMTTAEMAVEFQTIYSELMGKPQRAYADQLRAIGMQNATTLESLVAILDDEHAITVRDRYRRIAFPSLGQNTGSAVSALRAALRLPDLNSSQVEQLQELASSYFPVNATLDDGLIEIYRNASPWGFMDEESQAEWQQQYEAEERLKFEQSELNASAIARLGSILNEEQIRKIGGLPKLPKRSRQRW
ncbi:MAG: hypothetical protein AAF432_09110 [Planctomycetota bacterium]